MADSGLGERGLVVIVVPCVPEASVFKSSCLLNDKNGVKSGLLVSSAASFFSIDRSAESGSQWGSCCRKGGRRHGDDLIVGVVSEVSGSIRGDVIFSRACPSNEMLTESDTDKLEEGVVGATS